jgi:hypothetical protein
MFYEKITWVPYSLLASVVLRKHLAARPQKPLDISSYRSVVLSSIYVFNWDIYLNPYRRVSI